MYSIIDDRARLVQETGELQKCKRELTERVLHLEQQAKADADKIQNLLERVAELEILAGVTDR